MAAQHRYPNDRDDSTLPRELADDIAGLYEPPARVPSEIDENILFSARRQFDDTRRSRWWGGIGVAVASVMLVFLLQHALRKPPQRHEIDSPISIPKFVASREDIDGSGRVDILDAFTLARHLKAGESIRSEWDINQDGTINQTDVDAVAMTAVQLNGGSS